MDDMKNLLLEGALEILDSVTYNSIDSVDRGPREAEYRRAIQVIRDMTGIPPKPKIQWGDRFEIHTKARRSRGMIYPAKATGAFAAIGMRDDGVRCLRLTGTVHGKEVDRVFVVGETVSYDSYNLIYLGVIEKISDKQVTIRPQYSRDRVRQLTLDEFSWRNYNLDLDRVDRENAETRMGI